MVSADVFVLGVPLVYFSEVSEVSPRRPAAARVCHQLSNSNRPAPPGLRGTRPRAPDPVPPANLEGGGTAGTAAPEPSSFGAKPPEELRGFLNPGLDLEPGGRREEEGRRGRRRHESTFHLKRQHPSHPLLKEAAVWVLPTRGCTCTRLGEPVGVFGCERVWAPAGQR